MPRAPGLPGSRPGKRRRPYSCVGPGQAVALFLSASALAGFGATSRPPSKVPRARGTPRVRAHSSLRKSAQTEMLGPTDLDASQHRGMLKSDPPFGGLTASPPNPRRPARGVLGLLRIAPGERTISGFLPRRRGSQSTASGPIPAGLPVVGCRRGHHWGPVAHGRCAGTVRLGPPGRPAASPTERHIPGHRSPPRVWRR
jgi:hypothetical protein